MNQRDSHRRERASYPVRTGFAKCSHRRSAAPGKPGGLHGMAFTDGDRFYPATDGQTTNGDLILIMARAVRGVAADLSLSSADSAGYDRCYISPLSEGT